MRKGYVFAVLAVLLVAAGAITAIGRLGGLLVGEVVQNGGPQVSSGRSSESGLPSAAQMPAPDWELADLDGKAAHLSDFRGQPVVVSFWTTWNALATDQVRIFDTLQDEGMAHILMINSQEDKGTVANFIRRGGYHVRVLLDETGAVTALYNARVLPETFFIDREGNIKSIFIGPLSESMLRDRIQQIVQ